MRGTGEYLELKGQVAENGVYLEVKSGNERGPENIWN
jgi:hypothetical protein